MASGRKASAESVSPSTGDKRKRGSKAEEQDEKPKQEGQEDQPSANEEEVEEEKPEHGKPRADFL
jgi:hypothetical protein